jgi:hypothetical protein
LTKINFRHKYPNLMCKCADVQIRGCADMKMYEYISLTSQYWRAFIFGILGQKKSGYTKKN